MAVLGKQLFGFVLLQQEDGSAFAKKFLRRAPNSVPEIKINKAESVFEVKDKVKRVLIKEHTGFSKATGFLPAGEGDIKSNTYRNAPFFMTTSANAEAYTNTNAMKMWGCDKILAVVAGTDFELVNLRNTEFLKAFVEYYESDQDAVNRIKLMTGYDLTHQKQRKLAKKFLDNNKITEKFDVAKLKQKLEGETPEYMKWNPKTEKCDIVAAEADPRSAVQAPEGGADVLHRLSLDSNDKAVLKLLQEMTESTNCPEEYKNVVGYFWKGDVECKNWWHHAKKLTDEVALFKQYVTKEGEDKALWIADAAAMDKSVDGEWWNKKAQEWNFSKSFWDYTLKNLTPKQLAKVVRLAHKAGIDAGKKEQ